MMALATPQHYSPLDADTVSRRKSYPGAAAGELRYFPDAGGAYSGPKYTYEDGVLRRQEGARSFTRTTSLLEDASMEPTAAPPLVAKPARYYLAQSDEEAARLDAADGVINGALYGTPIYKTGTAPTVVPPVITYSPSRLDPGFGDASSRYVGPSNYSMGSTLASPSRYVVNDSFMAARLDAADGVLDGRLHGTPIETRRPAASYYVADSTAQALRFDAADGVLDGRHYGTPVLARSVSAREVMPSILRPTTTTTVYPAVRSSSSCVPCSPCTPSSRLTPITACGTPVTTCGAPLSCGSPSACCVSTYPSRVISTCAVEQYNPYADQFLDLRAHLEKDRSDFQQEKARELQELAIREAKLQLEKERVELERERLELERLRAHSGGASAPPPPPPPSSIPPPPGGPTIKVSTREEAQRLDMQDGVIDGKYNGTPIEIVGQGLLIPPPHLMGKRVSPPAGKGGSPAGGKGGSPPGGKGGKGGKGAGGSTPNRPPPVTPPRTNPPPGRPTP